jgi:vancomycin permeability regulator SanA
VLKKMAAKRAETDQAKPEKVGPKPVYKPFWRRGDTDGLLTLIISNVAIILTGGLSLAVFIWIVWIKGRGAKVDSPLSAYKAVFGLKLYHGRVGDDYRLRLDRAAILHNKPDSEAPIIILGGYTGAKISEAEAGAYYLIERGIAKEEIVIEDSSTHSLENLREVRAIMEVSDKKMGVTLISNRYHLARLAAVAKGFSIDHNLCAAEEGFIWWMPRIIGKIAIEAIFLHWYYTGKWLSTITGNRRMLDRIT